MPGVFEEQQGDDKGGLKVRCIEELPAENLSSELRRQTHKSQGFQGSERSTFKGPGVGMSLGREAETHTNIEPQTNHETKRETDREINRERETRIFHWWVLRVGLCVPQIHMLKS